MDAILEAAKALPVQILRPGEILVSEGQRTGRLFEPDGSWWASGASYRISFWPSRTGSCQTTASYPYWTAPLTGARALYVLHCPR